MPLPRRLHRGITEQPTHGLLFPSNHRERRPTPRIKVATGGCDVLGVELHFGKGHFTPETQSHREQKNDRSWIVADTHGFKQARSSPKEFLCVSVPLG